MKRKSTPAMKRKSTPARKVTVPKPAKPKSGFRGRKVETHFVKIRCEAIIGFAGNAYLPREFCHVHEFLAAGMRELGMLDKPPGEIPVWIQDGKFRMGLYFPKVCYPSGAKPLPTSAELAAAEAEVMAEWAEVKKQRAEMKKESAKAKEILKMARSATYGKAERQEPRRARPARLTEAATHQKAAKKKS